MYAQPDVANGSHTNNNTAAATHPAALRFSRYLGKANSGKHRGKLAIE
jgi:hypothetical protein